MEISLLQRQENRYKMLRELNKAAIPGGIAFVGDSITEEYPVSEMFPHELNIYNRGNSGIIAVQVLENFDTHITDLKPDKVFLLIGTNDLAGANTEDTAKTIQEICAKAADICHKVYLLSVYPVNTRANDINNMAAAGNRSNATICELNSLIKTTPNVTYIDVYNRLTGAGGELKAEYTVDGLHLSADGYRTVTQILYPYVKE